MNIVDVRRGGTPRLATAQSHPHRRVCAARRHVGLLGADQRARRACDWDPNAPDARAAAVAAAASSRQPIGTPLHLAARLDLIAAAKVLVEEGGASIATPSLTIGESASVDRALGAASGASVGRFRPSSMWGSGMPKVKPGLRSTAAHHARIFSLTP